MPNIHTAGFFYFLPARSPVVAIQNRDPLAISPGHATAAHFLSARCQQPRATATPRSGSEPWEGVCLGATERMRAGQIARSLAD